MSWRCCNSLPDQFQNDCRILLLFLKAVLTSGSRDWPRKLYLAVLVPLEFNDLTVLELLLVEGGSLVQHVPSQFVFVHQVFSYAVEKLGDVVARGALELDALVGRHHVLAVATKCPDKIKRMENMFGNVIHF